MSIVDNRIFVNNVPAAASQEHLVAHFAQFGSTQDVYLPMLFGTKAGGQNAWLRERNAQKSR